MMVVLILSKCPGKLRGDITKWLIEVSPMVFAGKVSSRIKDEIWERICSMLEGGKATFVFESSNEQRFDFISENCSWDVVDFDGLKLISKTG